MFSDLLQARHSIRRYTEEPVTREEMERILEAGALAPNAGGGQRTILVGVLDPELAGRLGRWNRAGFSTKGLAGSYVSREQPSLIDNPSMPSGFYGAPAVVTVFGQERFLYREADAFCCAENMVLMATELGLASCIVARGRETFAGEESQALLRRWEIPENYGPICFVILGHRAGPEPARKPLRPGRIRIVE